MRKQTALWTTMTGDRIRICDMSNQHLLNCIRMVKQYTWNSAYQHSALLYMFEEPEFDWVEFDVEKDGHPILGKLCDEARRRGIYEKA